MPTLKNFQSNGFSRETVKLCLHFYGKVWEFLQKVHLTGNFTKNVPITPQYSPIINWNLSLILLAPDGLDFQSPQNWRVRPLKLCVLMEQSKQNSGQIIDNWFLWGSTETHIIMNRVSKSFCFGVVLIAGHISNYYSIKHWTIQI